jgi:hypothetical protein
MSPQDFNDCVASGGKVVTKNLKGNRYIRICYKNGTSYKGEVKKRKNTSSYKGKNYYKNKKHFANKKKIRDSKALVEDLLRLKDHFNDKRM